MPAAANQAGPPILYLSAIFVGWSNGYHTAHYMFGPLPGEGAALDPGVEWYTPLKGATANAVPFFFDQYTVTATHVRWRTVWIPQETDARLLVVPHRGETLEVERFSVLSYSPLISQKTDHPLSAPRVVDVDITEQFNAAIMRGERVNFVWQVRQQITPLERP